MSGGNPPGPVMSGGAMPSPVVQGAGGSGENMEAAGRLVEQHLNEDNSYMELSGQLRIATHGITLFKLYYITHKKLKLLPVICNPILCSK